MITHHPDENTLSEYSAGSIDWAVGIAVASHLHYCSECRARVQALSQVGGALLRDASPEKLSDALLTDTLAKIRVLREAEKVEASQESSVQKPVSQNIEAPKQRDPLLRDLPPVVNKIMPQGLVSWKKVSSSLKLAKLKASQDKYEVAFHRISAGGKVVKHGHRGTEMTMVLKGSFSDEDGAYSEGDFIVRQPGDVHNPIAAQNQDCLCLTILEAPVALTGIVGRVINPFLRLDPQ